MEDVIRYLENFCQEILALHQTIRFAGLADYAGKLHASAYRKGLVPLIDRRQTEKYALQTVFRARSRGEFTPHVGEQRYATAVYEKLIRTTIQITHPEEEFRNMYLLISLDVGCDYPSTIEQKVLPFIAKRKQGLFSKTQVISNEYSVA
ncbi:MAG: hypothetical protein ACREAZ_08335 [Nitrososphaera sp.]